MSNKTIYGLAVGISRYTHLRKLAAAAVDAEDVATVIRSGVVPSVVKELLDRKATKTAILKELSWLAKKAGPQDTVIIHLSGHGGRYSETSEQAYFCPVESSSRNPARSGLSSKELTTALRAIRSERLVVLIDACYSGGIGQPRDNAGPLAGLTSRDVGDLIKGEGRMIMAASRPDESAWEVPEMRNGLFTNYLLEALRGAVARADGSIWANDVFSYVSRNILEHELQRPYQKANGEDFVVLMQNRESVRSRTAVAETPGPIDQWKLRQALRKAYDREEFARVCRDIGLHLEEDVRGGTFETQLMHIIDHCVRHKLFDKLIERVRLDHADFAAA